MHALIVQMSSGSDCARERGAAPNGGRLAVIGGSYL